MSMKNYILYILIILSIIQSSFADNCSVNDQERIKGARIFGQPVFFDEYKPDGALLEWAKKTFQDPKKLAEWKEDRQQRDFLTRPYLKTNLA